MKIALGTDEKQEGIPNKWYIKWTCEQDCKDCNIHFKRQPPSQWVFRKGFHEGAVVNNEGLYYGHMDNVTHLGEEISMEQFRKYVMKKPLTKPTKFQIGDRVKCVVSGYLTGREMEVGETGTVEKVNDYLVFIRADLDGVLIERTEGNIRKVSQPIEEKKEGKFKIGDQVRSTCAGGIGGHMESGDTGEVVKFGLHDTVYVKTDKNGDVIERPFFRLEKISGWAEKVMDHVEKLGEKVLPGNTAQSIQATSPAVEWKWSGAPTHISGVDNPGLGHKGIWHQLQEKAPHYSYTAEGVGDAIHEFLYGKKKVEGVETLPKEVLIVRKKTKIRNVL